MSETILAEEAVASILQAELIVQGELRTLLWEFGQTSPILTAGDPDIVEASNALADAIVSLGHAKDRLTKFYNR